MKQSNNNAVDLLLRSLARRERDESPGGEKDAFTDERPGSPLASDHLDADELNLYAEGVLPAPARARYTEHLADCGRCRGIVVGLAQAAGTSARYETANQQSGAGFWPRFAALFSPRVLGYAVPALVLTGVIAIGLLTLREQRRPELVAGNQQVDSPAAVNEPKQSDTPGSGSSGASPSTILQQKDPPSANADTSELRNNSVENRGLLAQTPDTNSGEKPTAMPAAKDVPESPQVAGAASSQPVFAPEPAPPKVGLSEADTKSMVRKEQPVEREAQNRQQDEFKLQTKDDSPTHGPARSRSSSVGGRRDADLAAEKRAASGKDKQEAGEEIETRTVSGRRFRRQGNVWIDTAYESSRGATNVARGSEQFRALVADEHGLRAIAEQLKGVVIVVWKNRVYRIQ